MNHGGKIATIGTFDGVHLGHRALIGRLVELAGGDRPLAISFRVSPGAILGGGGVQMLSTLSRRRRDIEALGADVMFVDFEDVRHYDAATFLNFLKGQGVGTLVMGFNNHIGRDRLDARGAGALGIMPVYDAGTFADNGTICSSTIRRALADGDVTAAAAMLGRPYTIEGTVVAGRQLGRTLGFRTANLRPADAAVALPADGVYAAWATVGGTTCKAMVNIGVCPSVDKGGARTIEAHLLDFDADIYGRPMELAFVRRVRDERRFDSVEALARQLANDRKTVDNILT